MRISTESYEKYEHEQYPLLDDDYTGYTVSFEIPAKDEKGAKAELYRMVSVLYRLIAKYYENPQDVKGICGVSNHSHDTIIIHKKEGNRGRKRKTFVGGKITKWHIHIYLCTKQKKLSTLCQAFKTKQDVRQAKNGLPKCFKRKTADKARGNRCYNATAYVLGQSTFIRRINDGLDSL